jgi:uncharacterized membrane protein
MKLKKLDIIAISIIVASFITSIYFYSEIPYMMASHWDIGGNANGYIPKTWGAFLMPGISLVMFLLFKKLPSIDPLKKNVKKFMDHYQKFIIMMLVFLFYSNALIVLWNVGFLFSFRQAFLPAFSVLFFFIGVFIKKTKRNWFIGIKTPWTMSNDKVWEKTHDRASLLFKLSGVVSLLSVFDEKYSLVLLLAPVLGAIVYLYIYSYVEYKKLKVKD